MCASHALTSLAPKPSSAPSRPRMGAVHWWEVEVGPRTSQADPDDLAALVEEQGEEGQPWVAPKWWEGGSRVPTSVLLLLVVVVVVVAAAAEGGAGFWFCCQRVRSFEKATA